MLQQRLLIKQDCQKMSIVGLGGTGKTQVALQFAYTAKEVQPEWSIFWVPALSMESFEHACAEIARALRIPQAADGKDDAKELVKQRLGSGRVGRWLLVVDNADDPDIVFGNQQSKGVVGYLPESEQGVVVYTTRTTEVAVSLTHGDVLELGAMVRQDAKEFLSKSLINKDLLSDDTTTHKLLDELTYLPLAIAQAAAYLNINRVAIAKYLRLLHNTEQDLVDLMSREFRDETRYNDSANAVATTWVVSFSQVRERDAVAADLLAFISCVEWKAIPRSLLPSVQSEARMEDAIGTLCGYSFLTRRGDDNQKHGSHDIEDEPGKSKQETEEDNEEWYDIHRLVHLATQMWVKKHGDASKVAEGAVQHVADVFPSDDYENRAMWRAYLPHALRLLEGGRDSNLEEQSELCLLVGRCLRVDGRIREAVVWLEGCHQRRSQLEQDNPNLLSTQHVLAIAYRENGQVQKAVELLEHVVEIQARVLQADHPSQLASQHTLAGAYHENGQVQKAVELLEHVVEIRARVLQADHPSQLASQHELAGAYHENGQVQKAVELLEHVVEIEARILQADHPSRLVSVDALAFMKAELAAK